MACLSDLTTTFHGGSETIKNGQNPNPNFLISYINISNPTSATLYDGTTEGQFKIIMVDKDALASQEAVYTLTLATSAANVTTTIKFFSSDSPTYTNGSTTDIAGGSGGNVTLIWTKKGWLIHSFYNCAVTPSRFGSSTGSTFLGNLYGTITGSATNPFVTNGINNFGPITSDTGAHVFKGGNITLGDTADDSLGCEIAVYLGPGDCFKRTRILASYSATGTITANDMMGGLIHTTQGATVGVVLTTPTANEIVSAIPNCKVGDSYDVFWYNTGANSVSISAGTNVTMRGPSSIGLGSAQIWEVFVTNATFGSEAVTIYKN